MSGAPQRVGRLFMTTVCFYTVTTPPTPCSGRLVNAFDMVRLHLFGEKDDEAQPGTPTNRLPSYQAMCELAVSNADVAALMSQERYEEAVKDFEGVKADNEDAPANWMAKLAVNSQTGLPNPPLTMFGLFWSLTRF